MMVNGDFTLNTKEQVGKVYWTENYKEMIISGKKNYFKKKEKVEFNCLLACLFIVGGGMFRGDFFYLYCIVTNAWPVSTKEYNNNENYILIN